MKVPCTLHNKSVYCEARVLKRRKGWALTKLPDQPVRITHIGSGLAIPQQAGWQPRDVRALFERLPDVRGLSVEQARYLRGLISKLAKEVDSLRTKGGDEGDKS